MVGNIIFHRPLRQFSSAFSGRIQLRELEGIRFLIYNQFKIRIRKGSDHDQIAGKSICRCIEAAGR
jgi:hypothetical protein